MTVFFPFPAAKVTGVPKVTGDPAEQPLRKRVDDLYALHLHSVRRAVKKADPAKGVEDGIAAIVQHVVGTDGWLALPLGAKNGPLHHREILLVQHLRHIR